MIKAFIKNLALKITVGVSILGFVFPGLFPVQTYFAPPTAYAASPNIFSYQGRLTNAAGVLQNGNFDFRFSIWNDPTPPNVARLWPAGTPGTVTLAVTDGVFNVNIGDTGYPDALTYDFNSTTNVYLQVEVFNSGTSLWETLSPRQQITSSGYAINANTLNGLSSGTSVNNILALDAGGDINIAGDII